ncbi:glycoside hydrolase family 32 protein [Aspergillus homomorphus CBS 101889]|uniref:Arabinanase/levansucrase/invertase n=1 Tax=Aspergillus homomorphus (strain CBS 101889) TaxID=1450537 RepID=A0A395HLJ8_ASPHC|nr:Arabinanase/levansucrase/invertase [Aspergillus homomorphus CBS 101889]RAL07748.1 Arabinanase/levansucrase/invertase [Aspergillus homomorphus CBS 101889]
MHLHPSPSLSDTKGSHRDSSTKQEIGSDKTKQWRPSYHITAPHGWLNDPCGLLYDPSTGLYHLSYQWNPKGNDWGNISWAHCVSSDLLTWKQDTEPCLAPSAEYDRCGVFTGCRRNGAIDGEPGTLTTVYTSVKSLPIHYTLPYVFGSESLSLATSKDGGTTWQRIDCNPILPGPPKHLQVTGWRDPFITQWSAILKQPGAIPSSNLCGFISGGIAGETPTVFVYSINPQNLREWIYVGLLVRIEPRSQPSQWSGDMGVNWEVANFVSLTDDTNRTHDFVIMGAEGTSTRGKPRRRAARAQLWMSIDVCSNTKTQDQALATLPDNMRHEQGWSGVLSIPRVVNMITLHCVMRARCSELIDITSIKLEVDPRGTYTVRTLGIRPDPRVEKLRSKAHRSFLADISLQGAGDHPTPPDTGLFTKTSKWELKAEILVSNCCTEVGLFIDHGLDAQHRTTLSWQVAIEKFIILRPSSIEPEIDHDPESAAHTLFTFETERGEQKQETLRIHAFWDASVLEVFINERTVISTRIYLSPDKQNQSRLHFFARGGDGEPDPSMEASPALLLQADIWDELDTAGLL